jgi:hypothetical protein
MSRDIAADSGFSRRVGSPIATRITFGDAPFTSPFLLLINSKELVILLNTGCNG